MSGFLSPKYLKYRDIATGSAPRTIDHDVHCTGCAYNLRGLHYGHNCPECGQMITRLPAGSSDDPLLCHDESMRRIISMGLLFGAVALVAAIAARLLVITGLSFGFGFRREMHYVGFGVLVSALWIAACFMMMRAVPRRGPQWNFWVQVAFWSQLLWIPAYGLFAWRLHATATGGFNPNALLAMDFTGRALAGIGALAVAYFMLRTAEEAELEDTAGRINNVMWALPIFTVFAALLPRQMPWLVAIFLMVFPLAWCWFMFAWARSLWEMHRHIAWAERLVFGHAAHMDRIAEQKRALEEAVAARIRSLSASSDDQVSITETCTHAPICHSDPHSVKRRPSEDKGNDEIQFMS